jgi:hypothetical protein
MLHAGYGKELPVPDWQVGAQLQPPTLRIIDGDAAAAPTWLSCQLQGRCISGMTAS